MENRQFILLKEDFTEMEDDLDARNDAIDHNPAISSYERSPESRLICFPQDADRVIDMVRKCVAFTKHMAGKIVVADGGDLYPQIVIIAKQFDLLHFIRAFWGIWRNRSKAFIFRSIIKTTSK